MGYRDLPEAKKDIGDYLMGYYNHHRPHSYNGGIASAMAEEKPNHCPVLVDHYIILLRER